MKIPFPRVEAGDTYKLATPTNPTPHLWIVLTDPDQQGEVAIVNLTTRQPASDATVILRPPDHPFVRHDTVVRYEDAQVVPARALDAAVKGGAARRHAALNPLILKRIQDGVDKSPFIAGDIREYVRQQLQI